MAKRFIVTGIWALVFFLGSMGLLFVAWRLYFALTKPPGQQPNEDTFVWLGTSFAFCPIVFGLIGAVLGILGRLPGTRQQNGQPRGFSDRSDTD